MSASSPPEAAEWAGVHRQSWDVWPIILGYTDLKTLIAVSHTCRYLCRVARAFDYERRWPAATTVQLKADLAMVNRALAAWPLLPFSVVPAVGWTLSEVLETACMPDRPGKLREVHVPDGSGDRRRCIRGIDWPALLEEEKSFKSAGVQGLSLAHCAEIPGTVRLTSLRGLRRVDLSHCIQLTDEAVAPLANCHEVILQGCPLLKTPPLGTVDLLDMSHCENVTAVDHLGEVRELLLRFTPVVDVSSLGNVRVLDLSSCAHVHDVRHLGGCGRLNLSWCLGVKDVSNLANVESLDLSYCTNIQIFGQLKNVVDLTLDGCDVPYGVLGSNLRRLSVTAAGNRRAITDSLIQAHFVGISEVTARLCNAINDISPLRFATVLDLSDCEQITSVDGLQHSVSLTRLTMCGVNVDNIGPLSTIRSLKYVNLSRCENLVDISALAGINTVVLRDCQKIYDVAPLRHCFVVDLQACENLGPVHSLSAVHNLDLSYTNVSDASGLGTVRVLKLRGCDIDAVDALAQCQDLDLSGCDALTDVTALKGVSRLNLSRCSGITDVRSLKFCYCLNLEDCESVEETPTIYNVPHLRI